MVRTDMVRAETARIRRDYKLAAEPLLNVERYDEFVQRLVGLRLIERLESQGLLTARQQWVALRRCERRPVGTLSRSSFERC